MCFCDPHIRTMYCDSFACQEELKRIQTKDDSLKDRKGRFSISADLLRTRPEEILVIFKMMSFVPFRAECMYMDNTIEYQWLSYLFDIIHDYRVMPEYRIEVTNSGEEITEVKVIKMIK